MGKKHKKSRITTVRTGETPTAERRCQNGGVTSENVDRDISGQTLIKRYKAVYECPLDAYYGRANISALEYMAGLKFRHAYFRGVLGIRVDNVGCGGEGDPEMAFITPTYSQQLLTKAYTILTPKQKSVIIDVCGHDARAGCSIRIKMLHRGLERLVDLWNISPLDGKFLN